MIIRDLSTQGKLWITGKDRVRFLHGLVTNDVAGLSSGRGCHACMLTTKGRLVGDLRIYCEAERLLVDVDPLAAPRVLEMLRKHIVIDDVEIDEAVGLGELGLYGEGVQAALERSFGAVPPLGRFEHVPIDGVLIAGAWDLGLPGVRLFGPLPRLRERIGGQPIGEHEAEALRIEAGEPKYGAELGEDHLPIESGLDQTISFTKGCYLGQEVIVRATQQGRINRKLVGLRLEGSEVAHPGDRLSGAGRDDAGMVTSSVVSERFGAIALGYVHRTLWAPGTDLVLYGSAGERKAQVTALPFTRAE